MTSVPSNQVTHDGRTVLPPKLPRGNWNQSYALIVHQLPSGFDMDEGGGGGARGREALLSSTGIDTLAFQMIMTLSDYRVMSVGRRLCGLPIRNN